MEEKKKTLLDFEVDDLFDALCGNTKKDINEFPDLVNLAGDLDRQIVVGDIFEGFGRSVDGFIQFWNKYDEDHNIPVEERKPIKLMIDSNGGSLSDTFTIVDAIKLSKTPIEAYVIGCAYSGGFFVTIASPKRYGYKHSSYVFHEGSVENGGTSGQFENFAAFYKKQLNLLKDLVIENTKITEEEYEKIKRDDIWYDAYEALEKGIIDEIVGVN